jgi:uncharacterized membrane protein
MDDALYFLIFIAAVGSGTVAGVFFAFSAFVMKALNRLTAEQSIAAMQSINVTVLNPLCAVLFFGTALASLILVIASFSRWSDPGVLYIIAGSVLYLIALLITGALNVPLNDKLSFVQPNHSDGMRVWKNFATVWTKWNHIRTTASLAASVFLFVSLRLI